MKEVSAGNKTVCQTPAVLPQAVYKRWQLKQFHENTVFELEIVGECWEASTADIHVSCYVQQFGIHPLDVLFYTEGQVAVYIAQL